jgi:hypothetical protein
VLPLQVPGIPPNAVASVAGPNSAPVGTGLPSDACAGYRCAADICTVPRCTSGKVGKLQLCEAV